MKHILESPDTMEAYAIIDCCYYGLQEVNREMNIPKSGLDILIDRQTGFGKAKTKEWIETSIDLLSQIIDAKKIIEADHSMDLKMMNEIIALKENGGGVDF